MPLTRFLVYVNLYLHAYIYFYTEDICITSLQQNYGYLTLRIKKNTSNNASASMTIREMPVRAPDSSADELDWHEHDPSACIPLGQAVVG